MSGDRLPAFLCTTIFGYVRLDSACVCEQLQNLIKMINQISDYVTSDGAELNTVSRLAVKRLSV